MSHNLSLPFLLKELKLTAISEGWPTLAQKARTECWTPEIYLTELCALEFNYRQDGRLQRLLKDSKLPIGKQLSLYNFEEVSGVNAQQIRHKIDDRSWVKRGHNILIFGASGLGKTHIASALGYGLLEYSTAVKFFSSTALVEYLQRAKHEFNLEAALKRLDKYEVLILDDIGYVKKSDSESQILFELIAYRYERGSLIITSNHAFSG